jgi:flagellar basal-body rod protein FlgC
MLKSQTGSPPSGVRVIGIITDPRAPQLKYDPQHPDANSQGYVTMPNVNLVEEMVNMISATRSYEAGVAAINASKSMALKALEIGR